MELAKTALFRGCEPEEVEAFVSALTDFLCQLIEYQGKYFKPDIMTTGDDVAASGGPFLSRENWERLYKPYFKKICDAIKAQGALVGVPLLRQLPVPDPGIPGYRGGHHPAAPGE